jgi:hypothetical protein
MALPAAGDDVVQQFNTPHVVDTHVRDMVLSVVYTNEPVSVERYINDMEQLLAEDTYKVVSFDLVFTGGRAGYDQKVAVAQLCVRDQVLVYHYRGATMPCERFAWFINSPDYRFARTI